VTVCGPFEWKRICAGLFLSFVYKCIVVDDPDIKRGFGKPNIALVEQKLLTLQQNLNLSSVDKGFHVAQSLVFCVIFSGL
jgi:hypothetical protein